MMSWRARLLVPVWILASAFADAQNSGETESSGAVAQAEEVTIVGQTNGSLTSATPDKSAIQKTEVPGGFTIKTADEMNNGRASNFEDLLQRTPGVFLQSENEAEVSKISIRGSGITSEDEPLGVMFLLDGLSYNQGDGETILEDFDVGALSHAEIFRGADAFKYGALTLGGAINLVPLTGYDASLLQTRIEAGSYGYIHAETSGGSVEGPLDEFASISGRYRDGFRDHSWENTEILFADLGYKVSEQIENRFYLTLDRTDRALPGGLTKSEMESDPQQANPLAVSQDWNKTWTYIRLADKVSIQINALQFDAGVFWFHRDLEERGFFSLDFRQGIEMFYSDNLGANLNLVSREMVFGHRNLLTVGLNPQGETENSQNYENLSGRAGATTARGEGISVNVPAYFEDQFYLTDQLSILAGAQAIYVERNFIDRFFTDAEGNQSHRQDFYGFNPKFGAIYEFDRKVQGFMNISRSWQPPSIDNLVDFAEGPNSSVVYKPLHPQDAWTLELGTRGERGPFQWDLSIYRSWLRNELLELNDRFGNDIGTTNVPRTIHQGVELGFECELLDHIFSSKTENRTGDHLSLDQTYTFNDFHFDDDPVYGNNRIGGIPIHVYEAQLLYQMPLGFYAGPNVQCNLSRYPVDHANTLFADPYALLGFRVGYRQSKGISVFLDCKNLTNERYASSVDVIADARTQSNPEIFHPGEGRAFYGGMSWSW
jgi:iron complex outermembrane receptor protein